MKRLFAVAFVAILVTAVPALAQTFVTLPAVDGTVKSFAAYGDTLYIAGSFGTVGGVARNGLAAIDLTDGSVKSWDPQATNGGSPALLNSVTVNADGSTIYFSGNFDKVGAAARNYLAAVSSTGVLQDLSATFNDQVSAVRVLNGIVYVIGPFTTVNGTTRHGFAGLDTTVANGTPAGSLNAFDPGLGSFGSANFRGVTFSADGTKMYVAMGNSGLNDFTDTQGMTVARRGFVALRLSDGRAGDLALAPKDSGFDAGIFCVFVRGATLYVGDSFDTLQNVPVQRMAAFNSEVLDPVFSNETGTGPDGAVRSIASDGTSVYVAGAFNNIGATALKGLAAEDPTTGLPIFSWNPQLSVGLGSTDTSIFVHNGIVFIGGNSLDAGATLLGNNIQYYGAVTAIPAPVVTPTPTPAPAVPTVAFAGKIKPTTKSKVTVKGTATGVVTSVTYKVGSKGGTANGTNTWKFPAKLKKGKNVISVTATGPGGSSSAAKITVTRK